MSRGERIEVVAEIIRRYRGNNGCTSRGLAAEVDDFYRPLDGAAMGAVLEIVPTSGEYSEQWGPRLVEEDAA